MARTALMGNNANSYFLTETLPLSCCRHREAAGPLRRPSSVCIPESSVRGSNAAEPPPPPPLTGRRPTDLVFLTVSLCLLASVSCGDEEKCLGSPGAQNQSADPTVAALEGN